MDIKHDNLKSDVFIAYQIHEVLHGYRPRYVRGVESVKEGESEMKRLKGIDPKRVLVLYEIKSTPIAELL